MQHWVLSSSKHFCFSWAIATLKMRSLSIFILLGLGATAFCQDSISTCALTNQAVSMEHIWKTGIVAEVVRLVQQAMSAIYIQLTCMQFAAQSKWPSLDHALLKLATLVYVYMNATLTRTVRVIRNVVTMDVAMCAQTQTPNVAWNVNLSRYVMRYSVSRHLAIPSAETQHVPIFYAQVIRSVRWLVTNQNASQIPAFWCFVLKGQHVLSKETTASVSNQCQMKLEN